MIVCVYTCSKPHKLSAGQGISPIEAVRYIMGCTYYVQSKLCDDPIHVLYLGQAIIVRTMRQDLVNQKSLLQFECSGPALSMTHMYKGGR